jgi:hypothetical protein
VPRPSRRSGESTKTRPLDRISEDGTSVVSRSELEMGASSDHEREQRSEPNGDALRETHTGPPSLVESPRGRIRQIPPVIPIRGTVQPLSGDPRVGDKPAVLPTVCAVAFNSAQEPASPGCASAR